jgi:DNA-binding GntR family transcriptional regulator
MRRRSRPDGVMSMANYSYPQELQQALEQDIASGVLAKGRRIGVSDLQSRYPAAPADLERVLAAALRKGLVEAGSPGTVDIRGKGASAIQSVFQHAAKSGLSPKSVVRAVEVVPASAEVAQRLRVAEQQPVFRQTRTRVVNGEVIANQNNYIPIEVCPGLETVDLSRTSFQETLEGRFHAVVARIEEKFEIRPGNQEDLDILGLPAGADVLVVERLSLSSSALPLVWADIHVRTDRYHYVRELWPEAAHLLQAT